jgi:hypothetical protein
MATFLRKHPDVTYGELATTFKIGRDVAQQIMLQVGALAGTKAEGGSFEKHILAQLMQVGARRFESYEGDEEQLGLFEDDLDEEQGTMGAKPAGGTDPRRGPKPRYKGQTGAIPDDVSKGESTEDGDEEQIDELMDMPKAKVGSRAAKLMAMAMKFAGGNQAKANARIMGLAKELKVDYAGAKDAAAVAKLIAAKEFEMMKEDEDFDSSSSVDFLREHTDEDTDDDLVEVRAPREQAEALVEAARAAGLDSKTPIQVRSGQITMKVPAAVAQSITDRLSA